MVTDNELLTSLTKLPTSLPALTVPQGWGLGWARARAEASTRLGRIGVFGDSISVGEIATNWLLQGYVGVGRADLQGRFGDGGSGYITHNYRAGGNSGGGQVTTSGAWTDVDTEGGILRRSLRPTAAGNGATITMPMRGTDLDLWFKTDPSFGTFHYQVDGGSFVPVALNSAASILKVPVAGLAAGDHTVVVRATTGTGRFFGIRGRNATGITIENMSLSQTGLNDLRTAASGIATADPYDNTVAARTLAALGPFDVIILALGAAEMGTDVDDTAFWWNMWDALASFHVAAMKNGRSLAQPPDLVIVAENVGQFDVLAPFSQYERDWVQLHAMLRDFATTIGAAFVDAWAAGRRAWEYWQALGYWGAGNTDVVHPGDLGHRDGYWGLIKPLFVW